MLTCACSPIAAMCYWYNKNKTLLLPLLCHWLNKNKNAYPHKNESINVAYKFIIQRSISCNCMNKLKILEVHTILIICPYYYSLLTTLLASQMLELCWHSYFDPHLGICTISSTGRQLQRMAHSFHQDHICQSMHFSVHSHKTMYVQVLSLLCSALGD